VPWHGDIAASIKTRAVKNPRGILLITPESLEALFVRRGLEIPRLFNGTRAVIIDELHSLLDTERGIQVRSLLTRIEIATGRAIRRVGLSATLGDMNLAREYLRPDAPGEVRVIEADKGGSELLRFGLSPSTFSRICAAAITSFLPERASPSKSMRTGFGRYAKTPICPRSSILIMRIFPASTVNLSSTG